MPKTKTANRAGYTYQGVHYPTKVALIHKFAQLYPNATAVTLASMMDRLVGAEISPKFVGTERARMRSKQQKQDAHTKAPLPEPKQADQAPEDGVPTANGAPTFGQTVYALKLLREAREQVGDDYLRQLLELLS